MKKRKIIRSFRLISLILSAVFLAAELGFQFIPMPIQEAGFSSNGNSGNLFSFRYSVFQIAESMDLEFDIPGIEAGEFYEFTAPESIYLAGNKDIIFNKGDTAVLSFCSLPPQSHQYGERLISAGTDSNARQLTIDEKLLVRCYIAYLEQTGNTVLFESETGLELNEKNALAVLTAIDEEIYNGGFYIPAAYPHYMRTTHTLRNVCIWLMGICLVWFAAMLIICHFVDTTGWAEENAENWKAASENRSGFKMSSLSKSDEREPPPDTNKNKTRQELFKDFKEK